MGGSAPVGTKRSSCPAAACFILSPVWPNSLSWEHTGWSCRLAARRHVSGWAGLPGGRARRVLTTKCEGLALSLGRAVGLRAVLAPHCLVGPGALPGKGTGKPLPRAGKPAGICSSLREAWAQGIKEVC